MGKLGLQLLTCGEWQHRDLPGLLAAVREVGYDGAEIGGDGRGLAATETIIPAFRDAGLALTGVHVGYRDCADEGLLAERIDLLRQAGSRFLICSGVADIHSLTGYEASAETFNAVGRMCLEAGLTFCYHNHAWEFEPLEGGRQGIYTLLERTDPSLVKLAMDVFWLYIGGVDPAEFIAAHADRAGYYHFKDGARTTDGPSFIELGQGDVDLVAAKDEAIRHPLGWIVCEQDRTELEPRASIEQSFEYLKQIGL